MIITFQFIAIALYIVATGLLAKQWRHPDVSDKLLYLPAALANLSHICALYLLMVTPHGIDIGFFSSLSFTAWLVAFLLIVASLRLPTICLGLIIFPFAITALVLRLLSDQQYLLAHHLSAGLKSHILFSILAYSLLSIAVAQALLLYMQDKHLHNKHSGGFLRALPPLETMEILLFRMIGLGFLSLSISLITGFTYLDDMFAQHLVHKTILSIIAWLLFALLLLGRQLFGWRGKTAIRWTISGFVLLMLAYFGSKFVIELVLQR